MDKFSNVIELRVFRASYETDKGADEIEIVKQNDLILSVSVGGKSMTPEQFGKFVTAIKAVADRARYGLPW